MLKDITNLEENKVYTLVEGEEKFKEGVKNGFRISLHKKLDKHGGLGHKPVVEVMMWNESKEAKRDLPYLEGAAFQKLHQHWIDSGDVVIAKV